jgi:hypothetical protein
MEINNSNNINAASIIGTEEKEKIGGMALADLFNFMQKIEWQTIMVKWMHNCNSKSNALPFNNRERMALLLMIQKLEKAFSGYHCFQSADAAQTKSDNG